MAISTFKGLPLAYFTETKSLSVALQYPGSQFVQALEQGSFTPILNSNPLLSSIKGLSHGGLSGALKFGAAGFNTLSASRRRRRRSRRFDR